MRERKPVPTDEVVKRAHDDRPVGRDSAADHPHSPIVVERASDAQRADSVGDRAQTHAHGDHVHSHPHGDVPHAHDDRPGAQRAHEPRASGVDEGDVLFPREESTGYRSRWEAIQTGFVDEPRAAVEQADALVSQITSRLTEVFTRERQSLEQVWARGDNASTEDLRIALKRYRAFFDRLLSL
jgi:hypothetical protein